MKKEVNMHKTSYYSMRQDEINHNNMSKTKGKGEEKTDRIITDPFGSWTGVPEDNAFEKPVQDVDDL